MRERCGDVLIKNTLLKADHFPGESVRARGPTLPLWLCKGPCWPSYFVCACSRRQNRERNRGAFGTLIVAVNNGILNLLRRMGRPMASNAM